MNEEIEKLMNSQATLKEILKVHLREPFDRTELEVLAKNHFTTLKKYNCQVLWDQKIIDEIHPRKRWRWVYGATNGIGWIHVRFPIGKTWRPPKHGWHIDDSTDKINPYKSITLLPIIHDIKKGGGGTSLYRGSHHKISYWKHNLQNKISLDDYITKTVNAAKNNDMENEIIEATGEEGDLLLMHPNLVHSASICGKHHKTRITFNLSIYNE